MKKQHFISTNFILNANSSILIGIYFLVSGYLLESINSGNFLGFTFNEETTTSFTNTYTVLILSFLFVISSVSILFSSLNKAKSTKYIFWNKKTKVALYKLITINLLLLITLYFFYIEDFSSKFTTAFLLIYAILIVFVNNKKNKKLYLLAGLCCMLAAICFLIPSYWVSSITIMGVAHIAFGIATKY